ncbi:MAG: 3',5'-cyclic-nucleotide phosphodiesterase [Pseudomonadota bacterium]
MRIRILGCSGGIGAGSRTSAMLVDDDVLIDAGTGIGDLSLDDLNGIRHVFLTHAHLDHIAGLPMLADSVFDPEFEVPLTVYARAETLNAVQTHLFNDAIWPDFSKLPTPARPMLRYHVCSPGDTVTIAHKTIGQRNFFAVDVLHSVPSLGYTVQNSDGAFAVSGDTKTNETLWPVLNACDNLRLLVIEVSFPDEMEGLAADAGHYCPKTLCRDLERLRPNPDIWLTGMKPGEEERIFRQVLAACPDRKIQMLSRGTVLNV